MKVTKWIALGAVAAAASMAAAFNWPQAEVRSDKFYSYFGQLRGGEVSTSLNFAELSEVKAAEAGRPIVVIDEYEDDTCFFPSSLGVAVVMAHKGGILSVYGNIDGETLTENVYGALGAEGEARQQNAPNTAGVLVANGALPSSSAGSSIAVGHTIAAGTKLGYSGNSGWQEGRSSLEFQAIDIASSTAINPRSLMPRLGEEAPLVLEGISLEGKTGERTSLLLQRSVPSGTYRVYRTRQVAMPYRTRVTVNGVTVDEISYDLLIQNDATISTSGHRKYTRAALYPDEKSHLIGTVTLTPGKNSLGLVVIDITGKETTSVYSLSVY